MRICACSLRLRAAASNSLNVAFTTGARLQLCNFLAVDPGPAAGIFFAALASEAQAAHHPASSRVPRHCCPPACDDIADSTAASASAGEAASGTPLQGALRARAVTLLTQAPPVVSDIVLTSPCAHSDVSDVSLPALLAALPPQLHASATRGHCGANATEWQLDTCDARLCCHLAQLLPRVHSITSVRLLGSDASPERAMQLVAHASQLTALCLHIVPAAFLGRCLSHATSPHALAGLDVSDASLSGCELPALAPALAAMTLARTPRAHPRPTGGSAKRCANRRTRAPVPLPRATTR